MCAFHQGQEANKSLHKKAEYKRAVDPSLFMTLQNRRGPYKGSPTAKPGLGRTTHRSPWVRPPASAPRRSGHRPRNVDQAHTRLAEPGVPEGGAI